MFLSMQEADIPQNKVSMVILDRCHGQGLQRALLEACSASSAGSLSEGKGSLPD